MIRSTWSASFARRKAIMRAPSRRSGTAGNGRTGCGTSFRRSTGWDLAKCRGDTRLRAQRRRGPTSITRFLVRGRWLALRHCSASMIARWRRSSGSRTRRSCGPVRPCSPRCRLRIPCFTDYSPNTSRANPIPRHFGGCRRDRTPQGNRRLERSQDVGNGAFDTGNQLC